MIEINLVPENMRKNRRAQAAAVTNEVSSGLPQHVIYGILGVFTAILVVLVIVFQVIVTTQISKRNYFKKEMAAIEKQRENIQKIKKEMEQLKERVKTFEKVVGTHTVVWAQKLNEISDHLPRGVWLTKVALEGKFLIVEGSAVSKTKTEIADIHALTGKLKASQSFMANLKSLELDMIKAHNVENLSVADFKIKAQLVN